MIITLTVPQAEALDEETFSEDDSLRGFPVPEVGLLGVILSDPEDETSVVGYAFAHPALTWEDEIVLHTILDDRAAELQAIRKAPKGDRSGMRADIRKRIRQDARKAARAEQRQTDPAAARREMRRDIRTEARIAERIAARKAEVDAADAIG